MPLYHYTCDGDAPLGEPTSGTIEADDPSDALRRLAARGFDANRIAIAEADTETNFDQPTAGEPSPLEPLDQSSDVPLASEYPLNNDETYPLDNDETQAVVGGLSDLVASGLPLPEGLEALANELGSGRSASVLRDMARRIEEGQSLADALRSTGSYLPQHLQGLIEAGMASGRLGSVLEEYVDLQRDQKEIRSRMWLAVTYPFVLLVMLFGLLVGFGVFICPMFVDIFTDFGTNLPAMTELLIWFFGRGVWHLLAVTAVFASLFLFSLLGPAPLWMRLCVYQIPIFGPFWRYSRLMPFARLMALFVEQEMPLPDALRWTAAGLGDRHLKAGCREAASLVEAGESLAISLAATGVFPSSMFSLLDWGGRFGSLQAAFRFIAESIRNRTHLQTGLAQVTIFPVALLIIVMFGIILVALFLPLIKLIETLS